MEQDDEAMIAAVCLHTHGRLGFGVWVGGGGGEKAAINACQNSRHEAKWTGESGNFRVHQHFLRVDVFVVFVGGRNSIRSAVDA